MMATDELQLGFDSLERAAAKKQRQAVIETLVPLAQELAQMAGDNGITVANLRHAARHRGIRLPGGDERALSFLGVVMRRAKLIASKNFRRSDVTGSHGNAHRVWVAQGFEA